MGRPRCIHGDSAPRYKNGACALCARARVAARTKRIRESGELAAYHREYRERVRNGIRCPCGKNLMLLDACRTGGRNQPSLYCSPECKAYYTYETCRNIISRGWRPRGEGRIDADEIVEEVA